MALPWIRVENALVDHPKVFALSVTLNDNNAGWYLIRLWSWTSRYAARGRLADGARPALEVACGWRGTPGGLVKALISAGFLDEVEDGLEIHDWWDMQGQAIEKSKKDAEKKRERRASGAETARVRRADGAGTIRNETIRNETIRDVTSKSLASVKPKPAPDARLKPLTERLVGIFRELRGAEYQHGGAKDATALKRLLGTHDVEVIATRWVAGLNGANWKQVSTFAQLASKWNDIAAPEKGAFDPNGGILTRPVTALVSKPCTVQGCTAESWDGVTCIEHAPEMLERA